MNIQGRSRWLVAAAAFNFLALPVAAQALSDVVRADPSCRQFNDGCSICLVTRTGLACSTPGIACIKKHWVCADEELAPISKRPPPSAQNVTLDPTEKNR
ncbi:hypothetical protein EET67_24200 [Pseudaminobacter arsenicus]|uniref:DUF3551 domain-containing protein n=1 Tax=Borborobacter arsenicus TaxID=1851146 RepID=A0A432UZD2_9HYPH|nr:hypothetical protein [Pseudaminobacter arsenicus]RUM95279.1 hypothetical protein EET67_24200 [Pseudaminobacter arsenicus]